MTQFEFYKSFLFVTELLLAESLYLYRFRRRNRFWLRLIGGVGLCYLFAWLFPVPVDNAFYFTFTFLMIFSFTILAAKFMFRESWFTVIFCCFAGYTTQHLSYEVYSVLLTLVNAGGSAGFYGQENFLQMFPNLFLFAVYMVVYVAVYFMCYFFFSTKLAPQEGVDVKKTFIFIFSIFILVVDILLNALVVYHPIEGGKLYVVIIGSYNMLCCIVSLYMQFEVAVRRKIETNFEMMQRIWEETKSQYEMSKETIEIINMKCHDIKHQIRTLGTERTVSPEVLKELEERIDIYDSVVKTGNEPLDVILTEKSLLCTRQHINFSYIVDGGKLSFMREEDTYALFGNIIDNAIEAVTKLEEGQRIINLHVKEAGGVLHIRENNYFADGLVLENGLPRTTKGDRIRHGFGLKSIRYICERYGGTMSIETEGNIFHLNIMLVPK